MAAIDNGTKSEVNEADTTLTVYSRYTQKALRNKDAVTADIIGVDLKSCLRNQIIHLLKCLLRRVTGLLEDMEKLKYDRYINRFLISL